MNEAEKIEKFKIELKTLIGNADLPISVIYYVIKDQYQEIAQIAKRYEIDFINKHLLQEKS